MSLQMMKRSLTRMLKQSIIDLCKKSVGEEGYVEIDGIVCITIGEEDSEEIVVKVHEIIGDEDDHYMPPRSLPPTSHAPQRSMPPPGRPTMSQGQNAPMSNAQMSGKPRFVTSSNRHPQQGHGPMYTQAGGPRGMGGASGHHGPDMYQRGSTTPLKNTQDPKKHPQGPQSSHMDGPVIKIEIDSDDEHGDSHSSGTTRTKKGPNRPHTPVCTICDLELPSVKALKQHAREAHGAVICDVCWQPFVSKADLDNHMKTHDKSQMQHRGGDHVTASPRNDGGKGDKKDIGERFKCGVCGNTSDARQNMVEHLRSGHEFQGCYTCMLCREYFPNKPTFTIHRRLSHADAADVTCANCGVGLEHKEVETHRKECCGDDSNNTPQKGKTPQQENPKGPAAKRQRIESPAAGTRSKSATPSPTVDKKHFECPICCQLLDTFQSYERHISKVHSRLVCSICAGTLKNSRAASQHMKRHTDTSPFTCDTCGIGNQSHIEMRRHMVVAHKHQPAFFTCPQCNLCVRTRMEFMSHMRDTHKVDFLDDDELENYVVFEDDDEEEMYDDEEDEEDYLEEEYYNQNHGRMESGAGQAYHGEEHDGYDMEEEDYGEGMGCPEELVTCNICELAMPSLPSLKEHISTVHHAVACETCWRPFLSKSELEAHQKTHQDEKNSTNKKPAVTKQIATSTTTSAPTTPSRSATTSSAANNSKAANTFKCGVCGTASDGRKGMVEHLKSAHEFLGCFTCLLCGEFFPNKPTFTIHRKLSHGSANEASCSGCGVGLMNHEFEQHTQECEGTGIDIKEAEWDGKKDKKQDKK